MLKVPFTFNLGGVEWEVVVTVRGMAVRHNATTGEARVELDDYDVHFGGGLATGLPVPVEVLDDNPELTLAAEALIADCILAIRTAPEARAAA